MTDQLDFLSRATARTTDPDTAKQAGAKAASDHGRQARLILVALVALVRPSTGKEIAAWLDNGPDSGDPERWDSVKVMRRIAKMREDGLVATYDRREGQPQQDGHFALQTRDGQCLQEATPKGRAMVREAA